MFLLLLLILAGDVEINPGPGPQFHQKVVLGSFHQGDPRFGESSGIQCACNALYSICFSSIKKVSVWKSFDLDYVLEKGDELFKRLGKFRPLFMDEMPSSVLIERSNIEIEKLSRLYGLMGQTDIFVNHDTITDIGNGLIFMANEISFSLIWAKKIIFFV